MLVKEIRSQNELRIKVYPNIIRVSPAKMFRVGGRDACERNQISERVENKGLPKYNQSLACQNV